MQQLHSHQLYFWGDKCDGQHRNLKQPQFCSHDRHLPQKQVQISGSGGSR
jgi:hypothetical protein